MSHRRSARDDSQDRDFPTLNGVPHNPHRLAQFDVASSLTTLIVDGSFVDDKIQSIVRYDQVRSISITSEVKFPAVWRKCSLYVLTQMFLYSHHYLTWLSSLTLCAHFFSLFPFYDMIYPASCSRALGLLDWSLPIFYGSVLYMRIKCFSLFDTAVPFVSSSIFTLVAVA
ncbi:hypothetical protein BJV78DRAFT_625177 [Lactifluus subvellereus]|nr:hypothetical protein BJV78DRAFT_625177 [Lactifluus subvellereus]